MNTSVAVPTGVKRGTTVVAKPAERSDHAISPADTTNLLMAVTVELSLNPLVFLSRRKTAVDDGNVFLGHVYKAIARIEIIDVRERTSACESSKSA